MEATSAVTGAGLCNITDQAIRDFWQNRDFAKIGLGIDSWEKNSSIFSTSP